MTDDNRIERADIGEAHIENLDVGSMNFGAGTRLLADIAVELEQQGRKSQNLLRQVLLEQNKNKQGNVKGPQQEAGHPTKGAKNETLSPKKDTLSAKKDKAGHGDLQFVEFTPPQIELKSSNKSQEGAKENIKGSEGDTLGSSRGVSPQRHTEELLPSNKRKNRTIEISEQPSFSGKAEGGAPKSAGFYLGDDGRVRRPDGKFASKVEVRRFNGDQGDDSDSGPGEKYQHSLPALMVRAVGTLMKLTGKSGAAGGQAGDVAGVAAGGSMFLAVKEMTTIASDTKEALKERGLTGVGGIAPYLKSQFGQMASRSPLVGGEKRRQPKAFAQGEQAKSAVASQQDKQAAQSKAVAEQQSKQSETQHDELLKKLDEVADELKPKGPGMLDSALDLAGDMFGRKKGGRGRRSRGRSRRLSGGDFERRARGSAKTRPAPRPRAPEAPRGPGKLARVRASMGRGLEAMPSVASAAGRTGGAMAKRGAAMGGAAIGRMAGMGAKAIPFVGQAIALGMAAYDGYDGYNDKEGQAKAFNLKDGEEATTGQKSAMAAAKALDLGGLTSGAAGLLGTAAGAMGFNKLQEALTFDPDDMARAIYEGMTIFDRKKPKERGGAETTINNITTNNSGITPRGVTDATGGWKGTPLKFNGAEAESGLPSGYLAATAAVESGGNWNAVNKNSGAMGGWQFMPKTAAGLGLSMQDAFDPAKSTKAMIEHTKQNQAYFEKTMGRSPEGRELYLMHQQGMGGGTKLLKNPNALAADVLNSKNVNGMQAVLQNGGRADMTAQEFTDMVLAKYDKAEAYNKANPGKAVDLDTLAGTKQKHEAPMMLRGGPKPGEVAPSLVPPAALAANAATKPLAAPMSLKPVSDIQTTVSKNEMKGQDKKPYAPGTDPNAGMLSVLKSMDKTLKDMSKKEAPRAPSGGPLRSGGKPQVSGHPTMSGPMADFANDRR
ncbi:transglycosylase SLT domain-containing protein [Aeromonas hydrophila]